MFKNKFFCISGKLKRFDSRLTLRKAIANRGGRVVDSVNRACNYLVIAGDPDPMLDGITVNYTSSVYVYNLLRELDVRTRGPRIDQRIVQALKLAAGNFPIRIIDEAGLEAMLQADLQQEETSEAPETREEQQWQESMQDQLLILSKVSHVEPGNSCVFRFDFHTVSEALEGLRKIAIALASELDARHIPNQIQVNLLKQQLQLKIAVVIPGELGAGFPDILYNMLLEQLKSEVAAYCDRSELAYYLFSEEEKYGRYWIEKLKGKKRC